MKLGTFDACNYIKTEEDCRMAMTAAAEEDPGDGSLIAATKLDIAKARSRADFGCETDSAESIPAHAETANERPSKEGDH